MIRMRMPDAAWILSSLKDRGFAEVMLPNRLAHRARALCEQFYTKPIDERIALAAFKTAGILGYYPSESEAQMLNDEYGISVPIFQSSRKRGYCSFDYIANDAILAQSALFGANRWPEDSNFCREAMAVYSLLSEFGQAISKHLLDAIHDSLGLQLLPRGVFEADCCSLMRLLRYPAEHKKLQSKEHTDYEFISLICADSLGLEVKSAEGSWRYAPCLPNKTILLAGDMMEYATAGQIESALHRVIFGDTPRLSVIFFQGLPLSQPISIRFEEQIKNVTFGQHLCAMLIRSSPHLETNLSSWEQMLGTSIPRQNPFRTSKKSGTV